jgi:hypothetical protein
MVAVTGASMADVKDAIRHARGKLVDVAGKSYRVGGVWHCDLVAAMRLLGWEPIEAWEDPNAQVRGCNWRGKRAQTTFTDFLRDRGHDGPFIVTLTTHYLAVGWGEVVDPFHLLGRNIQSYLAARPTRSKRDRFRAAKGATVVEVCTGGVVRRSGVMIHTLTDKQQMKLKSVRRCFRRVATSLERNSAGFAILARTSPACRALADMVPTLVRESRTIADLADNILRDGEYSIEQWNLLTWHVKRNAARTVAICDEALAADGFVP